MSAAQPTVVLGVTGGIAAYKAVEVCRRLVDAGVHVVPVMTRDAHRFVGEATFSALASEPVRTSLWEGGTDAIPHTQLGREADLVVVVPATARFLAAYAAGLTDGLLLATVLATRAPVLVAPAMHTEMWEHPALQENLATLVRRGVHVVPPTDGRLAGGDKGPGRLAEPSVIADTALGLLDATRTGAGKAAAMAGPGATPTTPAGTGDLHGRRVLVTAGGTREAIDPVRVITNRSSGKQGHAIAEAALARGAEVHLVTASSLADPRPGPHLRVVRVESAAQMRDAVLQEAPTADAVIMAAAVADFRPVGAAGTKLHKAEGVPRIELEATPDILAELGRTRRAGQVLVGFAAETDDVVARATDKLVRKGVDVMVANDVAADGVGFDHETNAVTILTSTPTPTHAPTRTTTALEHVALASKRAVADRVLDTVVRLFAQEGGTVTPPT